MPPEDRKYVRVYHDDLIRDYPQVYDNDALLAAWLRLLVVADAMWPTPPELPRSVRARPLARLTEIGLVIPLSGHRYRIRGLDAERTKRQAAARNAAAQRWHSKGNAEAMPSRAEPSKPESEPSRANGRADAMDTYWTLMGSYPNGRTKTWIEELVNEFDDHRVSAAIAAEAKGDRQGLLGRVRDRLRSEADKAAKARAAAETARIEAEAAAKRITPEQAAENRARVREELVKMGVKA